MSLSKQAVNVSCNDRVKQYPKGTLHSDDGHLFCSTCNTSLDHTRKASIDKHLKTLTHVEKRKRLEEAEEAVIKKQATISGSFKRINDSRDARNIAYCEVIEAFTAASIPLNKLDHPKLRDYLQTNVKNLGGLPGSSTLRSQYLPKVFEVNKQELKARVAAASSIVIVTDEASDSQDRFCLHVLFVFPVEADDDAMQMEAKIVDLVFLEHVNGTTVSQTIVQTLTNYGVEFNKVSSFVTDNASYMAAAYGNLKGLLPNCVHMTCNVHILSLVGDTWRKNFRDVDRLVACFKSIFVHCASRKLRYKEYLADKLHISADSVPLPPVPVITRWNSWFNTVAHHAKYVAHYPEFIDAEIEQSTETNALTELKFLLGPGNRIHTELAFVADSTDKLVELLTWCEGRHVQIHLVYNKMMDLLASYSEKSEALGTVEWQRKAFRDSADKLMQYYCPVGTVRFTQPALAFLHAVRLFDPQQAKTLTFNCFYDGIPGINSRLVADEVAAYKQAVKEIAASVQPLTFWFSSKERFPQLFKLAVRYLSVPTNSVDAERSVSHYTLINAPQRQCFTDDNLALHVMMAFNARNIDQATA
jgi:hypothetical protein